MKRDEDERSLTKDMRQGMRDERKRTIDKGSETRDKG
jgi:hypothetical protein